MSRMLSTPPQTFATAKPCMLFSLEAILRFGVEVDSLSQVTPLESPGATLPQHGSLLQTYSIYHYGFVTCAMYVVFRWFQELIVSSVVCLDGSLEQGTSSIFCTV